MDFAAQKPYDPLIACSPALLRKNSMTQSTSRRDFLKTSAAAVTGAALHRTWAGAERACRGRRPDKSRSHRLRRPRLRRGGAGRQRRTQHQTHGARDVFPTISLRQADAFKHLGESLRHDKNCSRFRRLQGSHRRRCDVVLLTTPPHFRPHCKLRRSRQATFVEKPVAVDAPGVRSILEPSKGEGEKPAMVSASGALSPRQAGNLRQVHAAPSATSRRCSALTTPLSPCFQREKN